jgi:hypothetical protein
MEAGRGRAALVEQTRVSASDAVQCSPHVFLPDGTDDPNPGLDVDWVGDWERFGPSRQRALVWSLPLCCRGRSGELGAVANGAER